MWILKGLKKGVITTEFPEKVSEEEKEMMRIPYTKNCPFGVRDITGCMMCGYCSDLDFDTINAITYISTSKPSPQPQLPSKKSLHVFFVDAGSCNACNREIEMLGNPYYDFHRLGIFFTPTPRHADVMLVAGFREEMVKPILNAYRAMPEPKIVVAVGKCASSCTIEDELENAKSEVKSGLESILPVSVKIPGCPPSPLNILKTLVDIKGGLI